jgi:hypothetical protein
MRHFLLSFLVITLLSASVRAAESLPTVITTALQDAASTGNPLVVDAVSDRMSMLFPSYKAEIATYTNDIITPAATVVAVVNQMVIAPPAIAEEDVFALQTGAGPRAAANNLAAELNALDVGAGEAH